MRLQMPISIMEIYLFMLNKHGKIISCQEHAPIGCFVLTISVLG
jgi:hypothetical protein